MINKLKEYKYIAIRIQDLEDEITMIRSKAMKKTSSLSPTPKVSGGSADTDRIGKHIARIAELEKQVDAEYQKLYATRDMLIEAFEALPPLAYQVFYKRYILDESFSVIADELNYAPRYIYNVHSKYLKTFRKEV